MLYKENESARRQEKNLMKSSDKGTQFKIGAVPWNKDKKGVQVGFWLGKTRPSPSQETREKMRMARAKQVMTLEHRQKIADSRRGEKNWMWRGGVTAINKVIRKSVLYREWREAVFKRDGYLCVIGGKEHGSNIHADHIKPFSLFPELRFELSNGRTLCVPCHLKTATSGNRLKVANLNTALYGS